MISWFVSDSRARGPRAVMLVAHPDDETVGLGARLAELEPRALVVVTDGAPAAAFSDPRARQERAALRARELAQALAAGGVRAEALRRWQIPDQQAAFELPALGERALALFRELEPELVLTHAYEGGHPDHDATAFAVQWAARALPAGRPVLLEMPYYHAEGDGQVWGRFAGEPGHARPLHGEPLARKRAMLAAYRSQADVLAQVPLDAERVRVAGPYDFSAAPPVRDFLYPVVAPSVAAAEFLNRARRAW
jgi:LmbE family N-acetylglucosaminyl deacetylase